jgi:hypothetical protein
LTENLRTTTVACIKYGVINKTEQRELDLVVPRQFDFEKIPIGLYTMQKESFK